MGARPPEKHFAANAVTPAPWLRYHVVTLASPRGQLVCQHLEGASAKLFEQYADILREYVRGRHGVYALYKEDRLYYVGLAGNLRSRLKQHLRDRHHR